MITNTGKYIINKYLLGQTSSYASHIALGCGANPVSAISFSVTNKALSSGTVTLTTSTHNFSNNDYVTISGVGNTFDGVFKIQAPSSTSITYTVSDTSTSLSTTAVTPNGLVTKNYSNKTSLDFEMFRVPITSRGYVTENGVSKIVLTAQLPTEERYEITEFGLYPASSNPYAGNSDSKILLSFTTAEAWQTMSATSIPLVTEKLDNSTIGTISGSYTINGVGPTSYDIFQTGVDNTAFNNEARLNRQERSRYFNNTILMAGNCSGSTTMDTSGAIISSPNDYIKYNTAISLNENSSTDELRLAFSVVNKVASSTSDPSRAKILVVFMNSIDQYASLVVDQAIGSSRYYVASKKIQDLYKTGNFSWNSVNEVRIYSSVEVGATPSTDYYIALDALRLENVTTQNPLYGLTGYTSVQNIVNGHARPIIKNSNTSNFVEFRFVADVI